MQAQRCYAAADKGYAFKECSAAAASVFFTPLMRAPQYDSRYAQLRCLSVFLQFYAPRRRSQEPARCG